MRTVRSVLNVAVWLAWFSFGMSTFTGWFADKGGHPYAASRLIVYEATYFGLAWLLSGLVRNGRYGEGVVRRLLTTPIAWTKWMRPAEPAPSHAGIWEIPAMKGKDRSDRQL